MQRFVTTAALLLLLIVSAGCAATVRTQGNLSETLAIMMEPVSQSGMISFESTVRDETLQPVYYKKNGERGSGGPKFSVQHVNTVGAMLERYATLKFGAEPGTTPDMEIDVTLEKVDLEIHAQNSAGSQFLTAMFGGENQYTYVVNQQARVRIRYGDQETSRVIMGRVSSDDVIGVGTGTSTSNTYRGKNSTNLQFARLLNESTNRLIIQLDKLIDATLEKAREQQQTGE